MFFYVKIVLFLIMEVFLWYLAGTLFLHIMKDEGHEVVHTLIAGYFVKNLLFYIPAIVMKATQMRLSLLCVTWMIILGIVILASIPILFKEWKMTTWEWNHRYVCMLIVLAIAVYLIAIVWTNGLAGSIHDEAYFIGDVATSVETNSISTHDPYTGKLIKEFSSTYFLETYETHSAVLSKIFRIHPLIVVKYIQSACTGLLFAMILYAMGLVWCKKNCWKALIFVMTGTLFLINEYGWLTQSNFFFFRGGEGKTVQAIVLIPFCIYQISRMVQAEKRADWALLFVFICASFGLNMSSLFLLASWIGIFFLVLLVAKRNWKILRNEIICMLPFVVFGGVYLCMVKDVFSIYIR